MFLLTYLNIIKKVDIVKERLIILVLSMAKIENLKNCIRKVSDRVTIFISKLRNKTEILNVFIHQKRDKTLSLFWWIKTFVNTDYTVVGFITVSFLY